MANDVKAQPVRMIGKFLVRDRDGRPKVDRDKLDVFWPYLSEEDRKYLMEKYDGYNPPSDS